MERSPDSSRHGRELHRVVDGAGRRVVLVHGFTQTSASWGAVASDLAADLEVVRVDAPGHGASTDVHADLAEGAQLLADAGGRATYVGYSMGGRMALRLALDRPDVVEGLVLIGATAGIVDVDERTARRAADEALAAEIEAEGVGAFLERWLAQPLFDELHPTSGDLAARRVNTAAGLASSLRLAGTGAMDPPWWQEVPTIGAPTLVLAGEQDPKFTALGRRLAAGIGPHAHFETVAGAGHAAHLQQPHEVAAIVRRFVARLHGDH